MSLCAHFPLCGGCQKRDIPYPQQLLEKETQFTQLFTSHFPDFAPLIQPILGCTLQDYFRNKMEFSFGGTDPSEPEQNLFLGLKKRGRFDAIIPLEHCYLHSPTTQDILATTAAFFAEKKITTWNYYTNEGTLRYLTVRHSKTTGEFLLILVVSQYAPCFQDWAQTLKTQFPQIKSIVVALQTTQSDTAYTDHTTVLLGEPFLEEELDGLTFRLSPYSFFQTNTHQAKVLYKTIESFANLNNTDTVLDLYCGTGTIGLYLARKAGKVIGVDENPHSIANAQKNAEINRLSNTLFLTENVKNFLKFNPVHADCIVIDPPRDGLAPKALKRVVERQANQVIYVSCNPKSLLRDLPVLLQGGYTLEAIQPVDMFPHSGHIEVVTKLILTHSLSHSR